MIRHPRVVGAIWLALGTSVLVVAAVGMIQGITERGDWSLGHDAHPTLFLLSWAVGAVVGGVLLLLHRASGQIWVAAASAIGAVLIAKRILEEPSAIYYWPLMTGILTFVLALSVYSLVAVAMSAYRRFAGRSVARQAQWEWGVTALVLMILVGTLFAPPLRALARQSTVGRWWRCRESPRVILTKSDAAWSMSYSWTPGFGPGLVRATVQSDGRTRVEVQPSGEPSPRIRDVQLPAKIVTQLAQAVDGTGLLCETPTLRSRRVWDLGRFAIQVRQGAYTKEVYFDECHTLEDGRGLAAVARILQTQQRLLGPEIEWGPYGSTSGGPPCNELRK